MVNWKELPEHLKGRVVKPRPKNELTTAMVRGAIERLREWPKRMGMNKTEAAYGQQLVIDQQLGQIAWWGFEAIKLRLASKAFYTPDFMVIMPDGGVELHEVKGFWRDDARLKIKVAAEQFPMFRFVAVKKKKYQHGYGWEREEF